MARKKKPRRSIFVRLLVIGLMVYMITTLVHLSDELQKDRKELAQIEQQKAEETLRKAELKEMLQEDSQAALIEKAARERLDFGFPFETYYVAQ